MTSDLKWAKFCQCKGQKGEKGEATWPRGLPPSSSSSQPCNQQRSIPSDLRGLLCLSVWLFAYLHSQFIQTNFYHSFVQIWACFNCSTPSKEKLSCLGEHYYHKILPVVVVVVVILEYHQLAIYSQGQQKKINYSAPIRDIELKFRG